MAPSSRYDSLVAVGQGNIGSQVVPLLGSIPEIAHVILVDCDRYESANVGFQRIAPSDVGKLKVKVQARSLRRLRPELVVTALACRFEDLPLGILRGSIILACVDSRAVRQAINRAAFALGIPWIDGALAREGSVRARAYLPGDGSCLECSWGPTDYQLLEQRLPCATGVEVPAATAAAHELGAIAAGLQVSLCRRLIAGGSAAESLVDRQWFLDVPSGRGWTAAYAPNPHCRLDHTAWDIVSLPRGSIDWPLRNALGLCATESAESSLSAFGQVFVRRLRCPQCQAVYRVYCRLSGRLAQRRCTTCRAPMLIAAVDFEACLDTRNLSPAILDEPLASRGFVAGDIVSVGAAGAERHYQLA